MSEIKEIDSSFKDVLNAKQNKLILHLKSLKAEKKFSAADFKEQIDACHDKIDAIAETISTGDRTLLNKGFNAYEIEEIEKAAMFVFAGVKIETANAIGDKKK